MVEAALIGIWMVRMALGGCFNTFTITIKETHEDKPQPKEGQVPFDTSLTSNVE
jgi:hypothetical protein